MPRSLGSTRRSAGERHGVCEIDTIDPAYYTVGMAMGKRRRHAKQASMWVATHDLPRSAAHPFYVRLNQIRPQST